MNTSLGEQMKNAYGASGMVQHLGDFEMARAKLVIVGIAVAIVMFAGMAVTSTMAAKIKKVDRAGGCANADDLHKAYTWGWASALAYAILMTLSGGAALALILTLFL